MIRKSLFINLALLLGTVIAFFAVLEIIVRMSGLVSLTPRPPQIFENPGDPELGYVLKRGIREKAYGATVTTNALGLRGPEVDRSKPVIAVLGDSITFGYGLEDDATLPARLQLALPTWSVVNGAAPGYGLGQEATLYHLRIAPLDPELLILVFSWNDLEDQRPSVLDSQGNLRQPGYVESAAPPCTPITEGILRWVPGNCWLSGNSAFFLGVRKFLSAKQEHRNLAAQEVEYRTNMFHDDAPQERIDAYAAAFEHFAKTLPSDLPKMLVIWPEKHVHYLSRPKIKTIAERHGFAVLDLYDIFGNTPESLPRDTSHPSPETVAQAAEVIAAALEYHGLTKHP